jgi:CheY-like chemotaxis protein/anti-sigma regulatory factor (Ser/Thr protein kinase)
MSHELRTPLNAVLGFAQLMSRDRSMSVSQRERLAIITRSGEHLLDLINHVLEMAKIESGRLVLANAPFDLRHLIDGVAELFVLRSAARQVALRLELAPDLPHAVSGDAARLRQILINLISNAVKFTHQGAVTVRASGERAGAGLRLRIDVIDTGEGIAADELDALFQPFVQTASGRLAQEGTGLGLAISREFARLMGGDISAVSRLGAGSTFTCTVELGVASSTPPGSQPRLITLATRGARWRALVADDVPANRRLLVELLAEAGFEVREAGDGAQAVTICEGWRPHLVLMDLRMPGTDGHAATRQIKQMPAGRSTVVIAVTAGVFGREREEARASGCDELITKPVRSDELLTLIARQLGLRLIELDPDEPQGRSGMV